MADTLQGGSGDDLLIGGEGNDFLEGGQGADVLDGGAGDDVLHADVASKINGGFYQGEDLDYAPNVLRGGSGDDHLYGADGDDDLQGGSGNDTLEAAHGSDVMNGGTGDDSLYAWLDGHDSFDGGAGIDWAGGWVAFEEARDQVFSINGSAATLTTGGQTTATFFDVEKYFISSGAGNDTLLGTGAAEVYFFGSDGNDRLVGSAGNDRLSGGDGDDTMIGGAGDDEIEDYGGVSTVLAGAGRDTIVLHDLRNNVDAGSGNDSLTIDRGYPWSPDHVADSALDMGRGDDTVTLRLPGTPTGSIAVDGGRGVDRVSIDVHASTQGVVVGLGGLVSEALDIDLARVEHLDVTTGSGDDTLSGGSRADQLDSGTGHDVLTGRGGNDSLTMGEGGRADGGTGRDHLTLDLSASASGVSFTFSSGSVTVDAGTSFTHMESFTFIGSTGNDDVTGSARGDQLGDGAGDDTLHGAGGNDVFTRGTGWKAASWSDFDTAPALTFQGGADFIDGGSGFDTLRFDTTSVRTDFFTWEDIVYGAVVIDLENQSLNNGLAEGLTISNIERVEGGYSADTLRGAGAAETLTGGHANDTIDARAGNDKLDGGAGADDLTGGAGRDQFVYGQGWDAAWTYGYGLPEDNSGDRIRDFTRGEDKIVFDLAAAGSAVVRSGSDPQWLGTQAQFIFDSDTHELWFDSDGTGAGAAALRVATLDNVSALAAGDFVFV